MANILAVDMLNSNPIPESNGKAFASNLLDALKALSDQALHDLAKFAKETNQAAQFISAIDKLDTVYHVATQVELDRYRKLFEAPPMPTTH